MSSLFTEMHQEAKKAFNMHAYNVAEPILQQLILQNYRQAEVYKMLGVIFYEKGQFSKAINVLKRALEVDPTYSEASVALSIIYNDLGRYEEGREIFEEAQSLLKKETLRNDPYVNEKLAAKHEELSDLYKSYNRFDESLEQLYKAIQLSTRQSELRLKLVETFIDAEKLEQALKEARSLVRDYPSFINARLRLALVFYKLGYLAEATQNWETVLLKEPRHPEALHWLGLAQNSKVILTTKSIDL